MAILILFFVPKKTTFNHFQLLLTVLYVKSINMSWVAYTENVLCQYNFPATQRMLAVSALWTHACRDSVTEPIWFTLSSRQLQAFSSTALEMRLGFVTVRSSPTTWMSVVPVKLAQACQSSWSNGSSMDTTLTYDKHMFVKKQKQPN